MRRYAYKLFVLILISLFFLVGCGGKPSGISDEMYDTAVYVVDAVDLYLDGESTSEETYEKIDSLNIPESKETDDLSVETEILSVKIALFGSKESVGTSGIADVKEARDDLANEINYKD